MNWKCISWFGQVRAALTKWDLAYAVVMIVFAEYFVAAWATGNREGDLILQACLIVVNLGLWFNGAMSQFYLVQSLRLGKESLSMYELETAKLDRVNSEIGEAIVECQQFSESAKIAVTRTCGRILGAMEEPE